MDEAGTPFTINEQRSCRLDLRFGVYFASRDHNRAPTQNRTIDPQQHSVVGAGVEDEAEIRCRKAFLRKIGYKL